MKSTMLASVLAAALAAVVATASASAAEKTFTATVVLQKGLDGYEDASDSSRLDGRMKLIDDVKHEIEPGSWDESQIKQGKANREEILVSYSHYRHLLRFPGLDRFILGKNAKVLSAKLELFYTDEFWSFYDYEMAIHRSLDGTKDNIEKAPAAVGHVFGERRGKGATSFRSWVTFNLRPEVIQAWVDDPKQNQGLVLRQVRKTDPPGQQSTGGFAVFSSNTVGTSRQRPKLTITWQAEGNVAPFAPALLGRFDGLTAGATHVVRWSMPEKPDLNGDAVHYEMECAPADAEAWTPVAKDISGDAREYAWNTAVLAEGRNYRLRLRAVDAEGAASPWTASDGAFMVVRRDVPFQVGVESPLAKLRREEPYKGPMGNTPAIELARNEYEGAQLVLSGVNREVKNLRVTASPLRHTGNATGAPKGIPASDVAVNFVGYVHTVPQARYIVEWVGLWPDPLLNVESVTLTPGKVQPVLVTVYAPPGAAAGSYAGTLTITGDGIEPQTVPMKVRVFGFDLPVRGAFRAMAIDGGPHTNFYGLTNGPEFDKVKEAWYDFLCKHRLPPGGYALRAWNWAKAGYPAKAAPGGAWDFSEADRWGKYLFDRGMNTFVAGGFAKLGKAGFPNEYSPQYRDDFRKFMTAYAAFLKGKGWLKDAVAYNIDEAPESMWEACKENYRQTKAVGSDIRIFQCLNDPNGVAALNGFFDVIDVNIGQYSQSAAPAHLAKGGRTWWCVCCWPSGHPNLFVDYPALDARIIGNLAWKVGIEGFEYWDISSWGDCMKPMGGKKSVDEVECAWVANSFGDYNGDGYLVYPGPNNTLLSSIRFEALRDGFEDYEYLAILKKRLAGKTGADADAARKLLELPDSLCKKDLSYTSDPKVLFDVRHKIAEAIEKLGK